MTHPDYMAPAYAPAPWFEKNRPLLAMLLTLRVYGSPLYSIKKKILKILVFLFQFNFLKFH